MSSWAKPGVKCVCVYTGVIRRPGYISTPTHIAEGLTYTIREVFADDDCQAVVRLTEVRRGLQFHGLRPVWDNPFYLERFQPLVPKAQEQDLALFHHLLSPSPADVGLIPAGVELVE